MVLSEEVDGDGEMSGDFFVDFVDLADLVFVNCAEIAEVAKFADCAGWDDADDEILVTSVAASVVEFVFIIVVASQSEERCGCNS